MERPQKLRAKLPAPPPDRPQTLWEAMGGMYRNVQLAGWQNLLELVMLSVIWFIAILSALILVEAGPILKILGILLSFVAVCIPFALIGPVTVGVFAAVDAMWFREAVGPFDALRAFWRGLCRHYMRSVGLGAIWILVIAAAYANLVVDRRFISGPILLAVYVLVLYMLLFVLLTSVYVIYVLATTDSTMGTALRIGTWEVVLNPIYTLGIVPPIIVVVIAGALLEPVAPLLLGGTVAAFSVSAVRFVPYRHPQLPETVLPPPPGEDVEDLPPTQRKR